MALTAKKMQFAKAIIAGKSNKDAALAAGYSVSTASASGSRLAKDPDVKKHLSKLRGEANPELAEATEKVMKQATGLIVAVDELMAEYDKAIREAGLGK
jgi:phage terminase small subunit